MRKISKNQLQMSCASYYRATGTGPIPAGIQAALHSVDTLGWREQIQQALDAIERNDLNGAVMVLTKLERTL